MATKTIKFRHRYHKLEDSEFTTIRGRAQFKKFKVGEKVNVETPDGIFQTTVAKLNLATIKNLSVEFLAADAGFPGFRVVGREDFIRLLNSFRAPMWQQVTLESEMTIITLWK